MSLTVEGRDYKIDSMLFDVDGTIWDSTGVVKDAWNRALAELGFNVIVDADRLKGLFGLPIRDIIKDIIPDATDKEIKDIDVLCDKYEKEYLLKTPGYVYEDMKETIIELSEKIPVIIVSNCQSGYIELVMEHLQIKDKVTDYICPGDSGLLKADNIKLMVEKHNLKTPVYVGDTHMDEEACNRAGVPIVFASYGFGRVTNPIAIIEKPAQLLDLL